MSDLEQLVVEMMSGDLDGAVRWINGGKDWLGGESPLQAWKTEDGQRVVVEYIQELSKYV